MCSTCVIYRLCDDFVWVALPDIGSTTSTHKYCTRTAKVSKSTAYVQVPEGVCVYVCVYVCVSESVCV